MMRNVNVFSAVCLFAETFDSGGGETPFMLFLQVGESYLLRYGLSVDICALKL